ncbi:universal stress protein [Candidatus Nitrotoga sp. M5]|uniref:universal stress protein n=1 Tax=Candidatus Nitrotoga sp. M5 TaxID=2890409 RepID=UPI001EF1A128|nr:universal stress protein [Candidatus Nitrotoga sp. M5]CAH1386681.1 Universal stress protein family 4 [Candidatus Nitrotoga sp. M5]
MTSLTRILATTDLSAPARHATERAALVSKDTAAPLDLLHVANLAPLERLRQFMDTTQGDMEQRVLDTARQRLQDLAASLQQRYGVEVGTRAVAGSLLAELAKESKSLATGLLVCGAKGESVIRRLLLGTTAMRVLSTTTCPVLVVKQAPHEPYRRLLVPVDFSPSSLRAILHARRIAPKADIVLLHVYDVPFEGQLRYASVDEDTINHYRIVAKQEAIQKLHALCEEAGLSLYETHQLVLHGDPTSRIIEQEQEQDCDLIVMGKHGESFFEELLLGSDTKRVLDESQSDVLVTV